MKFVQLARPLFLVALGLHALVLFLPTGSDESEAVVVEDVFSDELDIAESVSKTPSQRKAMGNQAPGQLPVADAKVPIARSQKSPKPATLSPAAVTRAAAPRAARVAQPARRPPQTPGAQTSGTSGGLPTLPASNASPSPTSSPATSPQAGSPQANTTPTDPPQTAPQTAPRTGSVIPDLSNQAAGQSAAGQSNSQAQVAPTITALASGLPESVSVPDSLLDEVSELSELLAYSEENTDDDSASQNRDDWKADIQRQANVGTVESIAPTEISDLTEIAYPIEVSKQADMEARSLSLCLENAPHDAEVGVLFDSQGNVADDPALIRSTGYEGLDEEIIATVRRYEDFPPNRNSKAYLLEFEIDYDAKTCVSLEELKE